MFDVDACLVDALISDFLITTSFDELRKGEDEDYRALFWSAPRPALRKIIILGGTERGAHRF